MGSVSLAPTLSPHGRLALVEAPDAPPLDPELAQRLRNAFERGSGHGLLQLGAAEAGAALPPVFSYWREFGAWYVTALCTHPDTDAPPRKVRVPAPPAAELDRLVLAAPPMTGAEYLTAEVLGALWQELDAAFGIELAESKCGIQDFLKRRNPAWNLVGRVHFNLAENRKDPDAPFAFLATYTTRLTANAKAQHLPLGKALGEYAGAANKDRLLSLLLPVQRASETCPWLKTLVDAGEIFHPLRWTPQRSHSALERRPTTGKRRGGGSNAGDLAGQPAAAPAGVRANRRQGASGTGPGRAARFPDGSHSRWRTLDRRRDPGVIGEIRWAGAGPRPLGRSGPRAAAPHVGALP